MQLSKLLVILVQKRSLCSRTAISASWAKVGNYTNSIYYIFIYFQIPNKEIFRYIMPVTKQIINNTLLF